MGWYQLWCIGNYKWTDNEQQAIFKTRQTRRAFDYYYNLYPKVFTTIMKFL